MTPPPLPSQTHTICCQLSEWGHTFVDSSALGDWSLAHDKKAQSVAEALGDRLEIRPALNGLSIEATSFVGRVVVGPIVITVQPKLSAMPLAQLLRYAYGLRDITTFDATSAPTAEYGFHDLLIGLLTGEVDELLHRGLAQRYVPLAHSIASPRGRIDVECIIRQGGVREARLPCRYHDRRANWVLNRIVLAGLRYAANLASDSDLRHYTNALRIRFSDVDPMGQLTMEDLSNAELGLTRLTEAYRPTLVLLRLLLQMQGIDMSSSAETVDAPAYLFDMNRFYQRLLSRFLRDNLVGLTIRDEYALRDTYAYSPHGNPRRLSAPSPRPDYALLGASGLQGFLDAKYRDIWDRGLPASWLYQLSVYALASPARTSVLLYATMSEDAAEEQIDVRSPGSTTNNVLASVINRPVSLKRLAELVSPTHHNQTASRQAYAKELVQLGLQRRSIQRNKTAVGA
jgi:5-methylcytosine-specific restriction enzyme subunit McrC